jgi:uncharacterized SAM-binding protein YcdF (DUF218 family)
MKKIKLVSKRYRWGLTWSGRIVIAVLLFILLVIYVRRIVPFLSEQQSVSAKVMVIEGYVPDYAYPEIIKTFKTEKYEYIITSGTTYDQGFYISGVETAAGLIRNSLLALGFDSTKVIAVPVPSGVFKDRTYNSAVYSYKYIREHWPDIRAVNIVSQGPHARRSKYLFKLVYEPEIKVGNIVVNPVGINRYNWYKSSRGFKGIINETISYFYVLFFFWPDHDHIISETKS